MIILLHKNPLIGKRLNINGTLLLYFIENYLL
jgi:hypothetical protein